MHAIKHIFEIIVFYPAVVLHELAHAIVTKLLGGETGNIITTPIIVEHQDNTIEIKYGSVAVKNRFKVFSSLSAIAPIIWWVVAFWLLKQMGLLEWAVNKGHLIVAFNLAYKDWDMTTIFIAYGIAQLLRAGMLSRTDIEVAVKSLFSVSGVVGCLLFFAGAFLFVKVF